ncbi:MAG: NAD(P)H-quinone oxidoreductase [Longimicrobiales bacterium]|nr:NAD(P)H-quinone oxidoreductase [Longimicrobiales bacterium]
MKAVVITEPGPPDVLRVEEVPDPEPGDGEIRVRVEATAVNRADIIQRRGHYPAPDDWPDDIPGLEYAGVVDAVGPNVSVWDVGDRVMGLVGGGGYAEYVVVPADEAIAVPDGYSPEEATAIPEAFITADDALEMRMGLRGRETLLIHAVGSGVGTAALQLARAIGATVIGTSRSAWKLERAREMGLDVAIDTSGNGGFAEPVLDATARRGVSAVLDLVGGPYVEEDVKCVGYLGRIVLIGLTGGRTAELDLGTLLKKRVTLVASVLRTRPPAEKAAAARTFEETVLPLLRRGAVRPVIHEVVPMADVVRAHELVESNETFGKVVLRW